MRVCNGQDADCWLLAAGEVESGLVSFPVWTTVL